MPSFVEYPEWEHFFYRSPEKIKFPQYNTHHRNLWIPFWMLSSIEPDVTDRIYTFKCKHCEKRAKVFPAYYTGRGKTQYKYAVNLYSGLCVEHASSQRGYLVGSYMALIKAQAKIQLEIQEHEKNVKIFFENRKIFTDSDHKYGQEPRSRSRRNGEHNEWDQTIGSQRGLVEKPAWER